MTLRRAIIDFMDAGDHRVAMGMGLLRAPAKSDREQLQRFYWAVVVGGGMAVGTCIVALALAPS